MDPLYCKIREASNPHTLKAWLFFEQILGTCARFLGTDPKGRATNEFQTVWWELYLAYALNNVGIPPITRAERT
jgi:hypothetical protein